MVVPYDAQSWLQLFQKLWSVSIQQTFSVPLLYAGAAAILLLERRFPIRTGQKTFTLGFFQDIVWVALQSVFWVVIHSVYVRYLTGVYDQHLSFLKVPMGDLPLLLKCTVWVLVIDFLDWFHHWLRHKVPWFWKLHEVHHSQKEMNLFTDLRYHALEYLISITVVTIPLLILQADWDQILYYMLIHEWYTRVYHARIRTNYGWLRYVLVTPQSHRVHHSIETVHYDKNFGVIFSFWDRLFGTQYMGWDEYPETGIPNKDFPVETSAGGLSLILTPIRQNIYPLVSIVKSLRSLHVFFQPHRK